MRGARWRLLLAGAAALLGPAAGCAPMVQTVGPAIQVPRLDPGAFVAADGARLPLRVWPASARPRAVIVALHGFNDYSQAFAWPAAYWARDGITTYAYDQRGFGAAARPGIWPGDEALVRDAATMVAQVRARHPGLPIYLLGESMGGAVALATMADRPPPGVRGLILVAPAVWGWARMNLLYRSALWLGAHTFPAKTFTGRGLKIWPSDNLVMLRQLGRDPLVIKATRTDSIYGLVGLMNRGFFAAPRVGVPTLVLYGDKDEIVPKRPVRDMVARLAAPHRFVLYRRGFHMLLRDQEGPFLWRDIRDWIADPAAPLYGRDATRPGRGAPADQLTGAGATAPASILSNKAASCSASCAPDSR